MAPFKRRNRGGKTQGPVVETNPNVASGTHSHQMPWHVANSLGLPHPDDWHIPEEEPHPGSSEYNAKMGTHKDMSDWGDFAKPAQVGTPSRTQALDSGKTGTAWVREGKDGEFTHFGDGWEMTHMPAELRGTEQVHLSKPGGNHHRFDAKDVQFRPND